MQGHGSSALALSAYMPTTRRVRCCAYCATCQRPATMATAAIEQLCMQGPKNAATEQCHANASIHKYANCKNCIGSPSEAQHWLGCSGHDLDVASLVHADLVGWQRLLRGALAHQGQVGQLGAPLALDCASLQVKVGAVGRAHDASLRDLQRKSAHEVGIKFGRSWTRGGRKAFGRLPGPGAWRSCRPGADPGGCTCWRRHRPDHPEEPQEPATKFKVVS